MAHALKQTSCAISDDITRPHIASLLFDENQVISTDGHRLHIAKIPWNAPKTLVTKKAIKTLAKLSKGKHDISFERTDDTYPEKLRVKSNDWILETKLIDADFPPYDQVIPKHPEFNVTVDAQKTFDCIKQLSAMTADKKSGVRLVINGVVQFEVESDAIGKASMSVDPIENTHTGDDLVIGFNMSYLLDALKLSGESKFSFMGPLDPVVIRDDAGSLSVIMPMRI